MASGHAFALLYLALIATNIGQASVFAILPPLGREVLLTEFQITALISTSSLCFALASTRWGRLSDRKGRKPVMMVGLVGYTVGTALFALVFLMGLQGVVAGLSLYLLLLVTRCALAGLMSAVGATCTAYAADISTPAQRTRMMARLSSATSLGMILGPVMVGILAWSGLLVPLLFAALLSTLALLLIARHLPNLAPVHGAGNPARSRLRFRDPRILRYVAAAAGLFVGFAAIQQTLAFRLQDALLLDGIATAQVTGGALMLSAILMMASQLGLVQHLRWPHERFLLAGLAAMLIAALLIASSRALLPIYTGMGFLGAGLGLAMPAITSAASLAVEPGEQGAVAGLITACPAFGFVAGPAIGGALYQINPDFTPLFSAAVFALVFGLLWLRRPAPLTRS